MGFLDNIRDRLRPAEDDYYDDEDYYDDGYDDQPAQRGSRREPERETSGVLGNTRRPEAESVSVYTRSGRPVAQQGAQPSSARSYASAGSHQYGSRDYDEYGSTPTSTPRYATRETREPQYATREPEYTPRSQQRDYNYQESAPQTGTHESVLGNTTGGHTPADIGLKAVPRQSTSGKLPPYVLKPASYDDVQMVVRRVSTGQPVVLSFWNTNVDIAKRILDFCLGLACGLGGHVDPLGERVFVVLPQDIELTDADIEKLVKDGTIKEQQ